MIIISICVCVCVHAHVQQELHMLNNSATSLYEKQTLCINVINQIIPLQQISQCCYLHCLSSLSS